ncbi:MAG: UvrD-helicase domain-containing protein [Bacteroidaceae bacterium]|nr:UvrD-helicase domain-containing protein [Bacteroidaceae bacterium]
MSENLKIYRASAGSGKTFTLALEYIKLLISNPKSYRNILAVTFTNKATAEMKERILGKLYGVANGLKSAADYTEKIRQQLPEYNDDIIRKRAGEALEYILHDYGHFRIQTIDAFFQSVLRSLAKELDLNGDMEISLDGEELLNNAVDTYIKRLEPETPQISQVVNYIEDKMSSGDRWKVDKEIKDFAKNILSEEYQQRGEKLREEMERDNGLALKTFYKEITALKKEIKTTAENIGNRFFELADGFTSRDFKYGEKGIWGIFDKMRNGDIVNITSTRAALAENPSQISSTCPNVEEIADLIKNSIPLYERMVNCTLSLEHYHQLAMLNNIAATLKEENSRENRFMLAETTHLLSAMIDKSATFIFEKIGTEINHIFIDEFQDTSQLQWTCFKVLLEEVLARGNFNLIVGDVKQSIYRWRNSDWNIMNNIGSQFRRDQTTFASQDVNIDGKTYKSTNYRSDRRIVAFNNALYRAAIDSIASKYEEFVGSEGIKDIKAAYEDVEQAIPQPKPGKSDKPWEGYAEVRILTKGNEGENFNEIAVQELMKTLRRLLYEENIAPRDIAILLRSKVSKMELVVDAFNKNFPGLKIVSDEAYKLSSSQTVKLVIAALRYIATPEDKVNILNLINLYNRVTADGKEDVASCYTENVDITTLLPSKLHNDLERLKGLPVYELIEQLFALLNVGSKNDEDAYIYSFLDYASQYINTRHADINKLLEAWDESLKDKCIPAESINSVRIMTIHKSKGLEFHTVIIPFCDWKLTGDGRNILWCKPNVAPYNNISLLPVNSKQEMAISIYKKDYNKEYLYQIVDNLNILYVATTRAKSNLIMFSDKVSNKGNSVSEQLNMVIPDLKLEGCVYDVKENVLRYGNIVHSKNVECEKGEEKADNPFEEKPRILNLPFSYYDSRIEFRQSRELARFLATDKTELKQQENIAKGELMHFVLSNIEKKSDIDKALEKTLVLKGLIATEEEYNSAKNILMRALDNPKAENWFNGTYKLFNERSILFADGEEKSRRPDRVMIKDDTAIVVDYKFAREREEHIEQVRLYMELLRKIGYKDVKGYLWYGYKNEIKEI